MADDSPEASLNLGGSMMMIRAVFDIMKRLLRSGGFKLGGGGAGAAGGRKELGAPGTPKAGIGEGHQ